VRERPCCSERNTDDEERKTDRPWGGTATLTVTDNAGATTSNAKTVVPITLTACGYRLAGLEKADLSWGGPGGASIDIYRNGDEIATVQTTTYTDNIDKRGESTYSYKVCATRVRKLL
jgi:hypothetical protein